MTGTARGEKTLTKVMFGGNPDKAEELCGHLLSLRPALDLATGPDRCAADRVDILLYEPAGPIQDLAPFASAAAIQSLWAGVETLLANPTLPDRPALLRMVEDGLTEGMTDYIVGHVYRAHLGVQRQQQDQAARKWGSEAAPLSRERRVGIVGLGALGRDAAQTLAQLRFDVAGWSRSPKGIDGVLCLHGEDGFRTLLGRSEILVLLAPLTPETANLMDAAALAAMPRGAHLINAARGGLIDEDALLESLDSGHIATATLDVMREEPLPVRHRFWSHKNVLITPHVAAATRMETAARTIVEQIDRFESGRPFLHRVDRKRGY